ncbi:MAG TPA: M48 family metallopeptidase [Rhodanobacteraceae bacterium]|nr:M48 family metallopeptidase [Rhodanobacteraceae bacterium]
MNFFAMQDHARRSSRRLVVLFILAVILIVAAVDVVVLPLSLFFVGDSAAGLRQHNVTVLVLVSVGVLVFIGLASLFRTLSLRSGGGAAVARGMGATEVTPDTTNPAWKRLRNVIEEIAIASGVPVPQIFVMEHESGINAFAAGYTPADAAVCVTQGSLDKLTRDELQGVIAHEFSHVLNGDMRLNIRLIGLLFGILVIGIVGRWLLSSGGSSWGRSRNSRGNGFVLIGVGLFIVGYIGYFFGRLIQAAVARSRESLADASAVQFTRQSHGIAGALKKIAALSEGSALGAQDTRQVAHLLFGEGIDGARLFATHPPLFDRIKSLDPGFDPAELVQIAAAWQQPVAADDADAAEASLSGLAAAAGATVPSVAVSGFEMPGMSGMATGVAAGLATAGVRAPGDIRIDANSVTAQVGNPGQDDYRAAGRLHESLPPELADAARDPRQADALILALAIARDDAVRQAQQTQLQAILPPAGVATVTALVSACDALHPMQRLPLAALAAPALRRLPRPRLRAMLARLDRLVHVDQRVEPSEYCLAKLVEVQVIDALDPGAGFSGKALKLTALLDELRDLMALMARWGNDDHATAQRAFSAAMQEVLPGRTVSFAWPDDWQQALDGALDKLDRLGPAGKELVVRGLTRAISDDGRVTLAEGELLRVVCAALHCPLPPQLATVV